MKVLIAEKPSVARDIARVIGASNKHDGYQEGNGYCVTWAFGHLIQLAMPVVYGFDGFNRANLPMLPEKFNLVVAQKYNVKEKKYETDAGVLKQLNIVKGLFEKASVIVVATDAGREGELIFRYIYNYLECSKPFVRLWISSLTDKAIKDGLNKLEDGRRYNNLYLAAKGRSEADWLVGLNATQALSVSAGNKGVLSVGRVQSPTLAMICERYLTNKNFKPEIYFKVNLHFNKNGVYFTALSEKSYKTKEEAENAVKQALECVYGIISDVAVKDKKEPAPLLYDLSTLQQDANKKFSLSADNTLKIAQSLYEGKLITYPRTGSRYIGDDVFETVPGLIKGFEADSSLGDAAKNLHGKKLNKRSVDGSKVTDHHALLPTGNKPSGLAKDDQNIYDLIASRLLESFSDDCIKKVTRVCVDAKNNYIATGSVILQPGWRAVKNVVDDDEEKNEDEPPVQKLPELQKDEKLKILKTDLQQKQTKPKPLHTEASLLKAMETAGREVEDEELREAMKQSGLGTPATRAAIIETLFTRLYVERQKKNIIPTEKGLAVYGLIKDKLISKPALTGQWEKKLDEINNGKLTYEAFLAAIKEYTKVITGEFLNVEGFNLVFDSKIGLGNCPKCKKGTIRKGDKNYYCTEYKGGCDFKIWSTIAGKKITDHQVKTLIEKGKTGIIKGFISKAEKPFDAMLILQDNQIKFDFPKASVK